MTGTKEQDNPIPGSDATTHNKGFDTGKVFFTSDVEIGQKNDKPDSGVDAAMADSPGVNATTADSSAGSVDSADKKDQKMS